MSRVRTLAMYVLSVLPKNQGEAESPGSSPAGGQCHFLHEGLRKSPSSLEPAFSSPKAKEAQDDLVKTKEELHLVMTAPPPPPPPVYEPVNYHVQEGLQDEGAEPMGYSAELSSEGILDDRNEEKRITEAEKNERVQRQLLVSGQGRQTLYAGLRPWYLLLP